MKTNTTRPTGRDQIVDAALDAAERLFAAAGPDQVSMRAIAAEAQVTYSLLNRHLGTKEQLIDRLLARSELQWRSRTADTDYGEALALMLGPDRATGSYLRLLAWSLLATDEGAGDAHRSHSALDALVPLAEAQADGDATTDPTDATAAALALIWGWRFFNPFIVDALALSDDRADTLHEQVASMARGLLDR